MQEPAKDACDLPGIASRYDNDPANLVQILRRVQDSCGNIPSSMLDRLAQLLRVPRVRIEAAASFYSFFHAESHGAYEILFSDNIIDHMQGKAELMQYLCERLWIEPRKLSEDGLVYVDETSDIGLADQGPAALVNGYALPSLSRSRIDLVVELIRARKPMADWPAMLFEVADNIRRADVLLKEPFLPGAALKVTLARGAEATLAELEASNLRGRGGAGFRTAAKWASCRQAKGEAHYAVCNADEGEPGTFKDRVLLQSCPDLVLEGMSVCARVIGAHQGFLYLRGEYKYLLEKLEGVLARRREAGLLGRSILGEPGFDFDIAIHLGAGAYICGEESALIESLEGKPGKPRNRPPYPDTRGYRNQPTVVGNVESFACSAKIAQQGGAWFAAIGTPQSTGTKLLSVSGDCRRPGIYEYPFGVTVRQVLQDCGAIDAHAVQIGGPSGTCISWQEFERRIGFEDLPTAGAFMVFSRERDMFEVARNFTHFFAHESCGFCTPCRVGTSLAALDAPLAYHWARMIEMLHAAEGIKELLLDNDLSGGDLVVRGERRLRGVGVLEAPRGTLFHHYRINEDEQIVSANLIVSTTGNNQAMNEAVRQVALQYLDGRRLTEALLNHIEVAIRAFDPCLSCATHALGKMPLEVQLVDADGTVAASLAKGENSCPP